MITAIAAVIVLIQIVFDSIQDLLFGDPGIVNDFPEKQMTDLRVKRDKQAEDNPSAS